MNHIVVTGIGLITPLGCGREITWQKVRDGQSLVQESLAGEFPEEFRNKVRSSPFINPNGLHRIFPLTLTAVREALADAKIAIDSMDSERIGCSVSVSKPILTSSEKIPAAAGWAKGRMRIASYEESSPLPSPFQGEGTRLEHFSPDSVNRYLARQLNIQGPTQNIVAACATGVHSILMACRWLLENKCDVAIAGSSESSLHPLYLSGFNQMGVLSDIPRPFDQRRNGFILGEGAGILILERKSDALARKACIYAEVAGCAVGSDTGQPAVFAADGAPVAAVLSNALKKAECQPEDVDYLNAHGTGTRANDAMETRAIKNVFGSTAKGLSISSTKASTGHLLGASGSVEAALTCLALKDQFIPPTVNLEKRDAECDLDYTPIYGKPKAMETAVSLSFGFGGTIGALVFKR